MLWGSAFPAIKFVYSGAGEITPEFRLLFAGIRFSVAGLLVILVYFRQLARLPVRENGAIPLKVLAVLTLFQTVLQYVFFYEGMSRASGVLGSILIGFGSIWWIILAPLVLKTPWPDGQTWLAVVVSLVGAGIAVYDPGVGAGSPVTGGLLFLAAAFSGAVAAVSVSFLPACFPVPLATGMSLLAGGLCLIILGAGALRHWAAIASAEIMAITLWLAVVSAAAFSIWNSLIQRYSVHLLAQFRFLIPLSGVVQSALLIPGESLKLNTAIGGFLVIASIWWTSTRKPAQK